MSKLATRAMPSLSHNAGVRPSSTVIVAKDAVADPEIFMVRRHEQSSFGAAHAFPGGVVDAEDSEVHDYCSGLTRADANARIGVEEGGLDFYSAAVRELFEETGVLLADITSLEENLVSVRDSLNDGSANWAEFVTRNKLQLHCGGELTGSCWATATEMLAAGRRGDVKLHFPTIKTLESIARHQSLDSLVDWSRSCVERGITSMIPLLIERDGQQEVVLPGDKDYPGAKS